MEEIVCVNMNGPKVGLFSLWWIFCVTKYKRLEAVTHRQQNDVSFRDVLFVTNHESLLQTLAWCQQQCLGYFKKKKETVVRIYQTDDVRINAF